MMGLQTGAAIVVDNDPTDAVAFIKALSTLGIAATHFSGDRSELPGDPLSGIRLAILDMDLTGGYTEADEATQALSALFKVLESVVSPSNGPYLGIIWSAHAELASRFEEMGSRFPGSSIPLVVKTLSKASMLDDDTGAYDVAKIARAIVEAVEMIWPFGVLLYWEQAARSAAVGVTDALGIIALAESGPPPISLPSLATRREKWQARVASILHALVRTSGGVNADEATALALLFESLGPINSDQLDHLCKDAAMPRLAKLLMAEAPGALLPAEEASLNRIMLFAPPDEPSAKPGPGNLYRLTDVLDPEGSKRLGISHESLIKDVVLPDKLGPQGEREEGMQKLLQTSVPIMLEVTPLCDSAQKSLPLARMVCGLLFPEERVESLKHNDTAFLWRSHPFDFAPDVPNDRTVRLVLDAHFVLGIPVTDIAKHRAMCRMRNGVLIDVQSWFGHHASRPGYLQAWKGDESTRRRPSVSAPPAPKPAGRATDSTGDGGSPPAVG